MYSTIPIHWNIKSAPASPGRSRVGPAFYVFSFLGYPSSLYKTGGPARQEGEKAGSWLPTVEEDRRSKMAKITGDGLATSSRDVYAQSECCVHCVAVIHYNHNRNCVLLYYLFQANKSFGSGHHLHSSSYVREVVSSTLRHKK